MEWLGRPLAPGQAIDWWEISAVEERHFLAEPEPMPPETPGRVADTFWQIPELPCRKQFRASLEHRSVELPAAPDWVEHSLGAAGPRLEFSAFWHLPTHVVRFARTFLSVKETGEYALRVETCGGARLWANSKEGARFEPFSRNRPATANVPVRLNAGRNELILRLEELCERDTVWFVGLSWLDERRATLAVPTAHFLSSSRGLTAGSTGSVAPDEVAPAIKSRGDKEKEDLRERASIAMPATGAAELLDHLRRVVAGCRLDREGYVGVQPLRLLLPEPARAPLTFTLTGIGTDNVRAVLPERQGQAMPGAAEADLRATAGFPQGYHELGLAVEAGGMRLRRKLAAAFADPALEPRPAGDRATRRRQALDYVARHGGPQIGTALALAATGGEGGKIGAIVDATFERIEKREDCSDFWILPLLYLWRRHPHLLCEHARDVILGYRYWIDEPGNDVMWFWSENHALCFHAAQYLAGEAFPDDRFACSGRTGREQAALGRERLKEWFADIEADGFIEWNSPAYYPIDAIGLFCLVELAADDGFREAARRCLDRLFVMTALSTLDGIPSSTQGRSYDRDLKFPALTETAAFAWVEWGKGALNPMAYALPLLCLGDYVAPDLARRLALWDEVDGIQGRYTQGRNHAARLVAWKSRDALLGSVVDFRTGQPGHQAVVSQLHLKGHPDARVWLNNPGEDDPFGTRRPSYWAGDGFMPRVGQWRSLSSLHWRLDDPGAIPWTHCYARREAFDEYRVDGRWLFLRSGDGLGAVLAANGLEPVETGPCAGYELRSAGRHNSWLLRAGSLARYGSLDGFAAAMQNALVEIAPGERIVLRDPEHGEVVHDWSGRLTVAGIDRHHRVDLVEPVLEPDGES